MKPNEHNWFTQKIARERKNMINEMLEENEVPVSANHPLIIACALILLSIIASIFLLISLFSDHNGNDEKNAEYSYEYSDQKHYYKTTRTTSETTDISVFTDTESTTETTTTEETTTTTETTTEYPEETTATSETEIAEPRPVTYSNHFYRAVVNGSDMKNGCQWNDPNNHSHGLSQIGITLYFTRNSSDGSFENGSVTVVVNKYERMTANGTPLVNYTGRHEGTGAYTLLDDKEQMALFINIQFIIQNMLSTPAETMKAAHFRFDESLVQEYHYDVSSFYPDWIRTAQTLALNAMNDYLNNTLRSEL